MNVCIYTIVLFESTAVLNISKRMKFLVLLKSCLYDRISQLGIHLKAQCLSCFLDFKKSFVNVFRESNCLSG